MKKNLVMLLSLVLLFGVACSGGKYGDIKDALNDLIDMQEEYINTIQKAQAASDVASAINRYADRFIQIKPRLESFEQKYPELKKQKEPPEELKESFEKLTKSAERLATASMTMLKYLNDPEVQKATERLKNLNK
jgi:hypothetical protein